MKKIFSNLLTVAVFLYALPILIFLPYFNWQYAKENGFLEWLILGEIVPTAKSLIWPYYILFSEPGHPVAGDTSSKVAEYTDNEYNYVFQFPSDWKMKPPPPKQEGDLGEVRVFILGQRASLTVTVGTLGKAINKSQYEGNPNSDRIVKGMIDLSIEQVYKKMSKTLNASRMAVLESRALPSNKALRFYVSTIHFIDGKPPVGVIGTHLIPFDKAHMIVFVMTVVADKKMKEDQKIYDNIFNSFHLIGEKPVALGKNGGEASAVLGNVGGKVLGTVEKIDGYGGYKFGMTLAEADAVTNDDKIVGCEYYGVRKCITRGGEFLGESETVVAQIDDKTQRIRQVVVSFEGTESGACDAVARVVRNTLLKSYGLDDVNAKGPRAEWHFPKGGSIGLLKLCEVGMNLVTVSFAPSERQPSEQ